MKKLSNQEMKKIAKSTLALVLAGTFTFSPLASAEENTAEFETVELQNSETPVVPVSEGEIEEAQTQVEDLEETNPSLIPGDFFYFAKIALEKIRLAFTLDDAKEAELLATYASERLAEASALFAEGKEDDALKVIEAAVEYMETSQDIVDEQSSTTEETMTEEETESDVVEETDPETEVEPETSLEDENEELDEENVPEEETSENPFEEIENVLRQNIVALTAAMNKVENPTAKAALQKNIDKTYAKMAKKLAKLEEKYGEKPEDEMENQTPEPAEADPVVIVPDLQPADAVEESTEKGVEETMPIEDNDAGSVVSGTSELPKASQVKQQHNVESKQPAKQERKVQKQAEKQQRTEVKEAEKLEKKEVKQEIKAEKKAHSQQKENKEKGKEKN